MTPRPSEASPSIDMAPAPEGTPTLLAKIWRVFSHPLWMVILMALTAIMMMVHMWAPQLPSPLVNDPIAASTWLERMANQVPGGAMMRALGLFDLAHNLPLRALLAILGAVLLLQWMNGVLRVFSVRRLTPPEQWAPGLQAWEVSVPAASMSTTWQEACLSYCSQPRMQEMNAEDARVQLCDCHHRWQWLHLFLELGFLLALASFMLNLHGGWQLDGLVLDPGQHVSLAPYVDKDVLFSDDASQIELCCPSVTASLDQGRVVDGSIWVNVVARGQAAKITLTKGARALQLQAIEENARIASQLIVHFPEARSERAIAVPEVSRAFRLAALGDGKFLVQVLGPGNDVLASKEVSGNSILPIDKGLTLHIEPTHYVVLRVQGRPWTWLLWPAALLAAVGLFARWRWPYWRMGVRSNDAGIVVRWQGAASTRRTFQTFLEQAILHDETN